MGLFKTPQLLTVQKCPEMQGEQKTNRQAFIKIHWAVRFAAQRGR